MPHLIKRVPEEKEAKYNAFEGITEVPRWRRWLEVAIHVAAWITILELLWKLLF